MDFVLFESVVVSLEFLLFMLELVILIAIMLHVREIRSHDRLMLEEMKELNKLHKELHETVHLLKEDIRELNENQAELHLTLEQLRTLK